MHPTTVLLIAANPYCWETAHFLIVPSVFKDANFSLFYYLYCTEHFADPSGRAV